MHRVSLCLRWVTERTDAQGRNASVSRIFRRTPQDHDRLVDALGFPRGTGGAGTFAHPAPPLRSQDMTTPAATEAAITQSPDTSTPLVDLTPAQLARHALRGWAQAGDAIHNAHQAWAEYDRTHDDCGHPLGAEPPTPETALEICAQSVLTKERERFRYLDKLTRARREMDSWLLLARTACDVAALEGDLVEVSTLDGYDLAKARSWFEHMCAQGEGDGPVAHGTAASRWRVMSPDQRAAARAIVGQLLLV